MVEIIIGDIAYRNIRAGFFESANKLFKHLRLNPIVAVDKSNDVGTGCSNTIVTSGGNSSIRFMYNYDTGIQFSITVAYHSAVVGRAIVNENNLNVFQCLSQNGINAFRQIFFDIVDRYNYTYYREIRFHILHIIVISAKLTQLDDIIKCCTNANSINL